jgi:hypothetical protein
MHLQASHRPSFRHGALDDCSRPSGLHHLLNNDSGFGRIAEMQDARRNEEAFPGGACNPLLLVLGRMGIQQRSEAGLQRGTEVDSNRVTSPQISRLATGARDRTLAEGYP